MDKNSTLTAEELDNHSMPNGLEMHNDEIHCIEAKKELMLSRNPSIQDCNEFMNPSNTAHDFYNSSGTPVSFSRRTRRKKLDVISDSEDEHFDKQPSLVSEFKNVNRELFTEDCGLLCHYPNTQNCTRPLTDKQPCCEAEKYEDRGFQCSETANNLETETCKSLDVSCVPESSFVPETEIFDGMELSSRTLTYVNVDETTEVSVSCGFAEDLFPVEENDLEAYREVVLENSPNNYEEVVRRGLAVMDECSRIDFNKRSISMVKFKNQVATDLVQKSWKKLRHSCADLKHYVDSEPKDAHKVLKLTSRMSDLISQADQLLSKCQMQDSSQLFPSENFNAFSWCEDQWQMVDTVSQHGFCFYAKEIDAVGSKMGLHQRMNLSQEMLASSTSTMALGRLLEQDGRASRTSVDGKGLDMSPSKCELAAKRYSGAISLEITLDGSIE
ncbi:hypothetical protein COLO4_35940 [Corchorus olitorius]|uniref:Uncharacterized protein n=1 Tax=Corchorus olitorius TaxID=93759 RepID=A0A1R3GBS6_9ROSI|nr:hypothetical protein COLO4_35940 [Corchorus olitorius]